MILADAQTERWLDIKAERDRRKANGVLVTLPGTCLRTLFP
jgi:hypothetical protein